MSKLPVALNDWVKSNGGEDTAHYNDEPTMCRQEFALDCDINTIMDRFQKTGILPANVGEPQYVDFTEVPGNLMDTLALFDEAQAAFMTLPAKVRREFDNDPHAFVAFASDAANVDQMREWGLAKPLPDPSVVVPVPAPGAVAGAPAAVPGAPTPAPAGPSTQSST